MKRVKNLFDWFGLYFRCSCAIRSTCITLAAKWFTTIRVIIVLAVLEFGSDFKEWTINIGQASYAECYEQFVLIYYSICVHFSQ